RTGKTENLFGDGHEHHDSNHPYTFDLDIFGRFSLFSFMNRTVTEKGSNLLATWLKGPSEEPVILLRQQAVQELSEKQAFKEAFLRTFFLGEKNETRLINWVSSFKVVLHEKRLLKSLIFILPATSLALLAGAFFISELWALLLVSVVINYIVLNANAAKVTLIHNHINNQEGLLLKYSRLIHLISAEPFTENLTSSLRNELLEYHQAEKELKKLSGYSRMLDNRYNVIVSILLNIFSFWEVHVAMAVEKWFLKNGKNVDHWVRIIGEFDALVSIAVLHYNHPQWPFADIHTGYFRLEAVKIGHPLIAESQRVTNDYSLSGNRQTDIITGSNMGGKSTFLRTLGVNMVLALAGAPVCAGKMIVAPAKIMTSMRVMDSLEENASSFYAELERIKNILQQVEHGEKCLLLLDEVLKGTNSTDRHTGSKALIRQLLKNEVAALIATHDLQLTDLAADLPDHIRNFHFDVTVENEELYFDYKLKPGICKSFNASLLMKKIGIDIDSL
ncbi:MAG: hypothetical protein R6U64_07480, partial [Bacteroidales bacterium]